MRIVVSGTHASGKSTLISDFAVRHPEYVVLPDPFDLVAESDDAPSSALFSRQLRLAADRLTSEDHGGHVIAERGPWDFLAYLLALGRLRRASHDEAFLERAVALAGEALRTVDVLVVLPLSARDEIAVSEDEDPALRDAMNDVLLDLAEDLQQAHAIEIAEIVGTPEERLAALEDLLLAAGDA